MFLKITHVQEMLVMTCFSASGYEHFFINFRNAPTVTNFEKHHLYILANMDLENAFDTAG